MTASSLASAALPLRADPKPPTRRVNTQNWHETILSDLRGLKNKPDKLTFLVPNGCQANLKSLIDIVRQNAGLDLSLAVAPVDDINTQLQLSNFAGGQHYELALPATFGIPDLATNNAIQALDKYAKRYQPEAFQNDALYTLGDSFDDKLYGYQTDGDAYLMFFNRQFLENERDQKNYEDTYGKTLGTPDTWAELDRQIAFFHKPAEGRYGGTLFRTPDYLAWEWWVRFHAKGYFPLQDDLEPQIANDAGVAALEELIHCSQYLTPSSRTQGLFDNWREYGQGHSYCNIGWGGSQKYLNSDESKVRGQLRYSSMPGGIMNGKAVRIPYFNWGWNYTVPSKARYPEAAYLCALLAVTPHVSTRAVRENGFFDPFRESHYQDKQIQAMYSAEFLSAHRLSMKESIPDFYLIGRSKYFSSLKNYLHRAELGEITPKKALEAVANAWRSLHYRYGVEAQTRNWIKIKQRYPQNLRKQLK